MRMGCYSVCIENDNRDRGKAMATFYTVNNRTMTAKTTLDAIKAEGLKKGAEITINNRHAVQYAANSPYADIEAVMIYEATGDDFTGHRI